MISLRFLLALAGCLLSLPVRAAPPPLVIIDPGHGGNDWGATVHGRKEKDICLAVAKKLREHLQKDSAMPVRLTREGDSFVPLDKRVEGTLDWEDAVFISLHVDDIRDHRSSGINVYAFGKSGQRWKPRHRRHKLLALPPPPREEARASEAFARQIARSLRADGFHVEGMSKAEYYVLRNPEHPSVLVELGYLSNTKEAARLIDPAYQDKIAQALARGLARHLADAARHPSIETVAKR